MIDKRLYGGLAALAFIVGTAFGVDSRYEHKGAAQAQHQRLAAEQEVSKLEVELRLIDLELKNLRAIKEIRQWTEEESAREEYLKQRRVIIEARLLELTRTA